MLMFSKQSNRRTNRNQRSRLVYGTLEDRRVLATISMLDVAAGTLTIELTDNNDQAVIDIQDGLVTVNGDIDVDSTVAGVQTIEASNLRGIMFNGILSKTFQSVVLNGDFTNLAGADMQAIMIDNISRVTVNGSYQLAANLEVSLNGENGYFVDGDLGQLIVGGQTVIDGGGNDIILNSFLHDFVGSVSLATSGVGHSIDISDVNDIELGNVHSGQNLTVTVGGDITDTDDSVIEVAGAGVFVSANVALGNNTTGTTNFGRLAFNVVGHVELFEDSDVLFTSMSTIGSLEVSTTDGIFDGKKTVVNVAGLASFTAQGQILLGDLRGDIFNVGQMNFNSSSRVDLSENSSMEIMGTNTAEMLSLTAMGDITDGDTAFITVQFSSGFVAENVVIGDTESDSFRSGSIYFQSEGNFFLNEDDGINIISNNNFAERLELSTPESIYDDAKAIISVATLAKFDALSVTLGDEATDGFNAGWIQFNTTNKFQLNEDSATLIVNHNTAGSVAIVSMGSVGNHELSTIEIVGVASISGTEITLGVSAVDLFNTGSLELNSSGEVTIVENSNTVFTGDSQVDLLRVTSEGVISDQPDATLNVDRVAMMTATGIMLGDTETDEFNATAITVHATGNVKIRENSGIHITGSNYANALNLTAAGNITDNEQAVIDVEFLLSVTGEMINLGTEETEWLSSGSLTFNSNATTNINAQETITLVGQSRAGRLELSSNENIYDVDSETVADEAFLAAVDVVLGDDGECFDVDPTKLAVIASGIDNVTTTFGCSS